jgi:chromate reductase, NAD(P)H dehydrogenase (quinone)
MRVLGINGSLRAQSSNAAILRAAVYLARVDLVICEFIPKLPAFNPDLDVEPLPAAVDDFRKQIELTDMLLICSPEYAHGVPGSLKNALDWLVSWPGAVNKFTILISASPGGAQYSHAQLLEVLRTMNLRVVDAGAHVFSRSALHGDGSVADQRILDALRSALNQFEFSQ